MALLGSAFMAASLQAQNPVGDWHGELNVNGAVLHLVVHFRQDSAGRLKASVDSPDQGVSAIPVTSVSVADSVLKMDMPSIGGAYEGRISADRQSIEGSWSQPAGRLPLVLTPQSATREETWQGTIEAAGGPAFRIVLHLAKAEGGGLRASIDSLDQGAYGIAVAAATEKGSILRLELPGIGASFEGHVAAGRETIDGTWSQGGGVAPLVLERTGGGLRAAAPSGIAGIWQGAIETPGARLRLQLHVYAGENGQFGGKLDSLDQGVNGLGCANITLQGSAFHFEIPSIGAAYDGTLNAARDAAQGAWTQKGVTHELNFKRANHPDALRRPQNPTKPYPYTEEEVSYPNAKAGIALAGALTIPRGPGPFPAALLIAGSGQQMRDEMVAGHSVFLVLADSLTRQGIAVLRADKRGVGKSTGNYALATSADFADDAEAGVAYLKTRREIDRRRIGLIGHSEGGIIAPMVASRSSDIAWIVILAGAAVKGEDILLLQRRLIDTAEGLSEGDVTRNADLQRKSFAIVHQERDAAAAERTLAALYDDDPAAKQLSPALRQTSIQFLNSPWMRYFLDYDPAPALEKTKCPVLALYGSKDLQVPPAQNLPALRKALAAGGNKDFRAEEVPDLNHLFQHAKTGSPSEYAGIEETVSHAVLDEICGWIQARRATSPPQATSLPH